MRNFLTFLLFYIVCACFGVDGQYKTNIPLFLDFDFAVQSFLDHNFRFDSFGLLTLNGKLTGPQRRVNLFFKELDSLLCEKNEKEAGVHFDLIVCVKEGGKCTNGMKICYKSELLEGKAKEAKYRMSKQYDGIKCEDSGMHGLMVTADNTTYKDQINFKIYSSIDKNSYALNVTNNGEAHQCFKIRVGTEESVLTQITDFEDEQIETEPKIGELSDKWWNKGWADSTNNFNLFALDFIPMKNDWEKYFGDYYKTFYYVGGGSECEMIMKFHGSRLHVCTPKWVPTHRIDCAGYQNRTSPDRRFKKSSSNHHGNFTFKKEKDDEGEFARVCCGHAVSEQTMTTHTQFVRNTKTSGHWNIKPEFSGVDFDYTFSLSIPGVPISKDVNLFQFEQYTKKTFTTKESKSVEQAYGKIMTNSVTKETTIDYCVDPCEEVNEQMLVLDCLGWQLNTGFLKATVKPLPNCDNGKDGSKKRV